MKALSLFLNNGMRAIDKDFEAVVEDWTLILDTRKNGAFKSLFHNQ
jgi:hypothetical protein